MGLIFPFLGIIFWVFSFLGIFSSQEGVFLLPWDSPGNLLLPLILLPSFLIGNNFPQVPIIGIGVPSFGGLLPRVFTSPYFFKKVSVFPSEILIPIIRFLHSFGFLLWSHF